MITVKIQKQKKKPKATSTKIIHTFCLNNTKNEKKERESKGKEK